VVEGVVEGQNLKGMMNIGFKPTVDGKNLSVEVHFFDFNQDIYGKSIQVSVVEKIREEQKFASVEELKMQLEKDKIFALNYFQP
jgi:riboflavin kinase/FMN adenylyltransferase